RPFVLRLVCRLHDPMMSLLEGLSPRCEKAPATGGYGSMLRHTAGQLAQALLLLVAVVVVIFCLLQLIPGDPVQAMVGDMPVPPALRAALEQRFHLNEPFLKRLFGYLSNIVHGDLGYSMNYRRPV